MFPIHCNTIEAYFWVKRVKLVKLVDSTFWQRPYAQTTLETWGETSGWESLERWGVAGKGIPPWAPVSVLADCWRGLARVRVRLWYDESGIWLRLLALITAGSCVKILRERNYLAETWVTSSTSSITSSITQGTRYKQLPFIPCYLVSLRLLALKIQWIDT